jgi:hypothetical protein
MAVVRLEIKTRQLLADGRNFDHVGCYEQLDGAAHFAVDPDVTVPLATYTGWNLRHPQIGAPERLMSLIGSTIPFPTTEGQRAAKGDPRRSIAARYCGKAAYLDQVSHAAQSLIDAGYLLPEDLERILAQSARRWDLLASVPESAAAQ